LEGVAVNDSSLVAFKERKALNQVHEYTGIHQPRLLKKLRLESRMTSELGKNTEAHINLKEKCLPASIIWILGGIF
jgi:hypothetical protein